MEHQGGLLHIDNSQLDVLPIGAVEIRSHMTMLLAEQKDYDL